MKGERVMKRQIYIGLVICAILIVLGMTPYLARGSNNVEDGAVSGTNITTSASTRWFFTRVDTPYNVGQYVSVVLHPVSGLPYVSYYDADHEDLRMAKYVGSGGNCGPNNDWSCETVVSAGNVGKYSSIVIDPVDNLPMIAYYDTSDGGALKLAIRTVFSWNIKTIDDPTIGSAGTYASLKLDSTGKPRIAYYFSNLMGIDSLWYAKYVGGGTGNCGGNDYQCDLIDSGDLVGKYTSIALDSSDRPRIAYYDGGNDALKYAYEYGGIWTIREILPTNAGKHASLYVDVNHGDKAHIAHYDSVNGKLGYAEYVGSGGNCGFNSSATIFEWQCDEIESVGTSTHPKGVSLAVDGDGFPIIAYQSGESVLRLARPAAALGLLVGNCGPQDLFYTWQCDTIRIGMSIGMGDYISLAANSAGLSTIAYYGNITASDGDLDVAFQRLKMFLPLILED
jgi:hypothetical protein